MYILECFHWGDHERELENLLKQVNDLEIELRGRHQKREWDESSFDLNYNPGASSRGSSSYWSKERSRETAKRRSESPHHGRHRYHNAALDARSIALKRATCSPFSEEIECTEMLRRFTRPLFTIYGGKIDPVEHVTHYIHMMSLYSHIDGLMCKVFPLSLGSPLCDGSMG